jgi:hypothetical protein
VPRGLEIQRHAAAHKSQPDEPDVHVVLLAREDTADGAAEGLLDYDSDALIASRRDFRVKGTLY